MNLKHVAKQVARELASRKPDGKYQFQWWAVSLVDAQPFQGKKKGADTGIDGIKFFRDVDQKDTRKIVVSVKGGENLKADDVRSVMAVRERDGAETALFISLTESTKGMMPDDLPADVRESRPAPLPATQVASTVDAAALALFALAKRDPKFKIIPAMEREMITRALLETTGNQVQAAKLLGITRATLRKRIDKYAIQRRLDVE